MLGPVLRRLYLGLLQGSSQLGQFPQKSHPLFIGGQP